MSADQQGRSTGRPSPRRLFVIAVAAAVVGLAVTLSFGYADHHPRPHGVRLSVFAPPAVDSQLSAGLAGRDPGAFTLSRAASGAAAERSVRDQSALGAFIIEPAGPAVIVTAGAQGTTAQTVITQLLTGVATAAHRRVRSVDVAALSSGDDSGLGAFVFELGLILSSVIASILLFLLGDRLRLWWRVLAALLFALLAAGGGTLAMDTIFGALTGAGGELIGVGFLGAATFVMFIAAMQALIGLAGTGVAAVVFVFLGNAISGGSVPVAFLPNGFRQVAPWLPNNAIVRGIRDVVYYSGHDLGHSLLVLGIWLAVSTVILIGVDLLHLRARATAPDQLGQIYRTSGIGHLRGRLAESGPAAVLAAPDRKSHPEVPEWAWITLPDPRPTSNGAAPAVPDPEAAQAMTDSVPTPSQTTTDQEPTTTDQEPATAGQPAATAGQEVPEWAWVDLPESESASESESESDPDPDPDPDPKSVSEPVSVSEPESRAAEADIPEPVALPAVPAPERPSVREHQPGPVAAREPEPEPVHQLPALPANSGIPAVPDLRRAGTHVEVAADTVTVTARTVVISAEEIRIVGGSVGPGSADH